MIKLLFYSDTADYGGHEAMTLEAVQCLAADNREIIVAFAFYEGNNRLFQHLVQLQNRFANLEIHPHKIRSRSLQAFRTLLSPWAVNEVKSLMGRIGPDMVIISQGRIESGSLGLLASKRSGLKTISYIPMAHAVSISGKPVATRLRESVNRYFYGLPDKFITISESSKSSLLARGAKSEIVVVPNGVEPKIIRDGDRRAFREAHGLRTNDYVVAVVARIEFRQKQQDLVVQALAAAPGELADCKFLFVGGGPDETQLRTLIASLHLEARAKVLPWSDNSAEIYAGIGMLLIPSRFEGVPLVMLEAMSCGLPVVASNLDGMADLLCASWLFPAGDAQAMVKTIARVKESDSSAITQFNKDRVLSEFSVKQFCMKFCQAVCSEN